MRFHTTILTAGKTAAGIVVPPEVIAALGPSRKPAVKVTIREYTYRSTVAPVNGQFMVGAGRPAIGHQTPTSLAGHASRSRCAVDRAWDAMLRRFGSQLSSAPPRAPCVTDPAAAAVGCAMIDPTPTDRCRAIAVRGRSECHSSERT